MTRLEKSWFARTVAPQAPGLRAQLLALLDGGLGERGARAQRIEAFLAVNDDDVHAAALALSRRATQLGLPELAAEDRQRLARPASLPPPLWLTLARLARGQAQLEARAGVTGDDLLLLMEKEEALLALASALADLTRQVGDSRRLLQGLQCAAQQRVLGALAQRLSDADPAERLDLLGAAGPLLDAVDDQLRRIREGQKTGAQAAADQAAAQADAEEDLLLLRTLRALQAGEPVDEDLLRRAAQRYAERGRRPPSPPPGPKPHKPRHRQNE